MKIAVLSNVNMNATIRILRRNIDAYEPEGYGNDLAVLLNPSSGIYEYSPDMIFLIEDIQELTGHETTIDLATKAIEQWFLDIAAVIRPDIIYYISDVFGYGVELSVLVDKSIKEVIENVWLSNLRRLVAQNGNVRIFNYKLLVEKIGVESSFSTKMWYMGKIVHSSTMQQLLAQSIMEKVNLETKISKKVLLLDLDNTLWGGLAGENDITPIILSDDHSGLAYKNLQRVILQMKKQGVILGIVSKNNEEDALNIINEHPHMILREHDFAIKKINWENKSDSILAISKELNVGLDSIVFFDDNPAERQLIKEVFSQVVVPDFPERPEELAECMIKIWKQYFERPMLTDEDQNKTEQYVANFKREELRNSAESFESYLMGLNIVLVRKIAFHHIERITQLINKTNQFNLTTKRHTVNEIQQMIESDKYEVFAYQEKDKFGDSGIIAVVIVNVQGKQPVIEEFVMSCRVMGKNIEFGIIDDVEQEMLNRGFCEIFSEYSASSKNIPVSNLYDKLGYKILVDECGRKKYGISLVERPKRNYYLTKNIEDGS